MPDKKTGSSDIHYNKLETGADNIPKVGEEYREEVRKRVVMAALDVFSRRGFHDARMDEIAEKASVSKGTLYNQFESKEDLFRGITEYLLIEGMEKAGVLLTDSEPLPLFKTLYEGMNQLYGDKAAFFLEVYAISLRDQKMHDILTGVINKEKEGFAQLISIMQAEGRIRRDVDPASMAALLMSLYMGLLVCGALDGGSTFKPESLLDVSLKSILFENPAVK